MKKEKINSIIILSLLLFYMFSYSFGFIYSLFEKIYSIINIIFLLVLMFNNRDELLKEKKRFIIIMSLQVFHLMLCKIFTHTGYGSILQMLELTMIIFLIPLVKMDLKHFKWLKYILPIFYIVFFLVNKSHLNTNYVGYIFLCCYLIGIMIYNLDRKDNFYILLIYTIVTLILINTFRCRTAMLATVIFFSLFLISKRIIYNKKVLKVLPYILTFGSLAFAMFYVLLWKTGFKIDISFFASKSLFSGRNRIWSEALPLLFQNPIFGLGSKYDLASFPAYALHNSIFMISLTFGIPNLVLFFINFKKMLEKIVISLKENYMKKIVIIIVASLLIVDFFESYIYWSNYNFLFFFLIIFALNRNQEFNNKRDMAKTELYMFEEGIDRMGGVERIMSTLSNKFVEKYDVHLISFYKTRTEPFFQYNKKVKITYLTNQKIKHSQCYKNKKVIYYFFRILEELKDYIYLNKKIAEVTTKITNNDIVIFGRIDVALKVLPFLEYSKKIITRDAIHYLYHKPRIQRKIKKILPHKVNTLIVSSDESKKVYLENMNCKNMKIMKIYNPLGIIPECKYNFQNKMILSVGRYAKQKGFENLIKAYKIVHETVTEWNLKIVGAKHENLSKLADELQLQDNIELVENNKNIVEVLNEASIFVLPSRYEGYANALVEAMACGVPSITYNWLLGANEIIDHERNGLIVNLKNRYDYAKCIDNEEDVENLAKAILKLVNDKEKCLAFSKLSSKQINENRNVDLILSKWAEELDC